MVVVERRALYIQVVTWFYLHFFSFQDVYAGAGRSFVTRLHFSVDRRAVREDSGCNRSRSWCCAQCCRAKSPILRRFDLGCGRRRVHAESLSAVEPCLSERAAW